MKVTKEELYKAIGDTVGKEVEARWKELNEKARKEEEQQVVRKYTTHQESYKSPELHEKPHWDMSDSEKGLMAARCLRYLYAGNGNASAAIELADRKGDKQISELWGKALGETSFAGGGALLPSEFAAGIIGLLSAQSVVRASGVTTVPMNSGSLTLPYIATGSTASYTGENTNVTASEPTFGQLHLSDKKLAALIPTSNDLLRSGGTRIDAMLRDDIVRAMRLKEDLTFIRSDGSGSEPRGMKSWALAANTFNANATANVANVTDDLGLAINKLEGGDVSLDGAGWIFSPIVKKGLMAARDGNGNLVWAPEMRAGTLMGYPYRVTSQIPENLGGGSDESEVYFAHFPTLVLAENESIMVEAFPGGAYHDGSNVVSGISQDQTVVRAIALHDFGPRQRGAEIAVIEQVDWDIIS